MRLEQGYEKLPAGVDIVTFLQRDGKPPEDSEPVTGDLTLGRLRDQYLEAHSNSLEQTTLDGIRLHFRHLVAALGERFPIGQ